MCFEIEGDAFESRENYLITFALSLEFFGDAADLIDEGIKILAYLDHLPCEPTR